MKTPHWYNYAIAIDDHQSMYVDCRSALAKDELSCYATALVIDIMGYLITNSVEPRNAIPTQEHVTPLTASDALIEELIRQEGIVIAEVMSSPDRHTRIITQSVERVPEVVVNGYPVVGHGTVHQPQAANQ